LTPSTNSSISDTECFTRLLYAVTPTESLHRIIRENMFNRVSRVSIYYGESTRGESPYIYTKPASDVRVSDVRVKHGLEEKGEKKKC